MTPDEIPQDLLDILDKRAGKVHSRQGSVVACLAEILTRYDERYKRTPEEKLFYEFMTAFADASKISGIT